MKAIETVLHLARQAPRRMRHLIPAHVWSLVEPDGLAPGNGTAAPVEGIAGDVATRGVIRAWLHAAGGTLSCRARTDR